MTLKIIFDTSILPLRQSTNNGAIKSVEEVAKREIEGFISVLTEAELYSGKECNTDRGLSKVRDIISLFTTLPLTSQIAQQAGFVRRKYGIEIPDAIIAATASVCDAKVWTKNVKDFEVIKEIRTEEPY